MEDGADSAEDRDDGSAYWRARSGFKYYRTAVRFARLFAPRARSVLDVGSGECEYVNWLDWIPRRASLDHLPQPPLAGAEMIQCDFMEFDSGRTFDVVLCLQVLEHLPDPPAFARKLLAQGKVVIISVPYRWIPDFEETHEHDPVDEAKLLSWTGRPWLKMKIVGGSRREKDRRLVAAFPGDACSALQKLELRLRALR